MKNTELLTVYGMISDIFTDVEMGEMTQEEGLEKLYLIISEYRNKHATKARP